jgi:aminotransferase
MSTTTVAPASGGVSPLRRRLASRVAAPEEGFRTRMLELAAGMSGVIALGRGDPDLPTPPHIVAAAKEALDRGATHYTHPAGDLPLRQAVAEHIAATTGVRYDPATEIIVTTGAQEAVYLAMLTLLEPGDEVLLPSHRFTSYDMAVELSGGRVVAYSTVVDGAYRLDAGLIEGAASARATLVSVVSPDNPTGGVARPEELAAVAELARRRDLLVLSDEIYSQFVYDGRAHASILAEPGMRERTLLVDGLSKCYAMTGWRVGYLAGPADYMRAIVEVKHTLTICTPAIAQAAALAALTGPQDCIAEMRAIYDDRRHCLLAALADMDLPYVHPAGAFYVYVDVSATGMSSPDFCLRLLQDTGVMIFPGTMFGSEGERWVRMSLLAPRAQIEDAADRLIGVVRRYREGAERTPPHM